MFQVNNPMAGQMQMPGGQMAGTPMPMPGPGAQMGGQLPMTMPPAAPLPPPKFHDVTIVTKKTYACARVEGVPPEEFGIERNARSIKTCNYCFHEVLKTEDDLIGQGFDADQIKKLDTYTTTVNRESLQRDTVDEGRSANAGGGAENTANRLILVTEHYVRMDYRNDGKVNLYKVTTGSEMGDILKRDGNEDVEQVDDIPFAAMTPVIVTHRFFGRSIADLIMDLQRIKTALLRGLLDNLYLHNNPRVEVSEAFASENTLDDLLVSRPGGIVRTKNPGGLNWQVVPDITGSIYPALQYFDAVREWRTGVSRQGQGVDPNALQNQVATIANQMADAAQAKTKLIARIFAETGIKDMFQLLHGIIRKNGQQAETVRLRNKWVNVDPRDWKERNDLTVNVGLGTGSKQAQLAGAQLLLAAQEKATALGLVSKKNVYKSLEEMTKLLGHKDVDNFFTLPEPPPQQPGMPGQQPDPNSQPIQMPPDPKQAEIQAKAQAEQQKMAADQQHQQAQFQRDTAHEKMKLEADIHMQQTKLQTDTALAQQKFELERELKLIDAQIKREQHQHEMQAKTAQHAMTMQAGTEKHQASMREADAKANEKQPSPVNVSMGDVAGELAKTQAAHTEAIVGALKEHSKPRRIRKNKDGSWQTETVT